jgi:hypothetical protein
MAKASIFLLLWIGPAIGVFCYGLWFVVRARVSDRVRHRHSGGRSH